jgi:hypothetical protein
MGGVGRSSDRGLTPPNRRLLLLGEGAAPAEAELAMTALRDLVLESTGLGE